MFRRIAEFVYIFKWPISLAMILVTLVMARALTRLEIDPSMEPLFVKNSSEYEYYRQYSEKYGSDQMVAVAMSTPDLFTLNMLTRLDGISRQISQFDHTERVLSLANARDIQSKFIGVKTVPVLEKALIGEKDLEELRSEILANELYKNNLVSKDGKIANILVYIKATGKGSQASGQFIQELRNYLAKEEYGGVKFYVAGSPVEQFDFIRLIRRDQFTFVPLITLLLILTTLLIYRSWSCLILSMSIVFMTLLWTMGSISLLGQQLNLVTSLLAPVIMIISVVNSIYLMNTFMEIRPHHPSLKRAVTLSMEQMGVPCFLTHFTTILGFLSLALNPIPAIKSFGIFAALGTLFSYIVEIVLTPVLLPTLPYRFAGEVFDEKNFFNRFLIGFIEKLDIRWKWWIIGIAIISVFFSVKGIQKIEVDTNIVRQLKPDLPLSISTRFIDENLTGIYSLGFVFKRRDGDHFVDYETLEQIDQFKTYLEGMNAVSNVNSITTVIKKINFAKEDENPKAYRIPDDQGLLKKYFESLAESDNPEVWKVISPDLKEIRLDARMRAVGTTEGAQLEENARVYIKKNLSQKFESQLTGNVVLLGKMAKGLVDEQLKGFAFAFASILFVIIILFRSLKLGLLAAIPNLIPILAVYGLMGYMGIELSSPTAMIASIVLGLVVDASIQFLYRFQYEFKHRHHYLQSLHHTYRNTGQSMVVSTFILVAGFSTSIVAGIKPTMHFGLLTGLTIFLALFCTLVILPVCTLFLKPFGPNKPFLPARPEPKGARPKPEPHKTGA